MLGSGALYYLIYGNERSNKGEGEKRKEIVKEMKEREVAGTIRKIFDDK